MVVTPLVRWEPLPANTLVKLLRKAGYLLGEGATESTALAVDAATQEYTETSVTLTATKIISNCVMTIEAQQFGNLTMADMAALCGKGLGMYIDDVLLALFTGPTTKITSSSVCTLVDVLQAAYSVRSNTAGVSSGVLRGIFDYKAIYEIQKELTLSGASHLANPSEISLLAGAFQSNGYVGSKAGVDFFCTSGLPTSGSDDQALVMDSNLYIGAMMSPTPIVRTQYIEGGVGDQIDCIAFLGAAEWNDYAGCIVSSDT